MPMQCIRLLCLTSTTVMHMPSLSNQKTIQEWPLLIVDHENHQMSIVGHHGQLILYFITVNFDRLLTYFPFPCQLKYQMTIYRYNQHINNKI